MEGKALKVLVSRAASGESGATVPRESPTSLDLEGVVVGFSKNTLKTDLLTRLPSTKMV